MLIAPRPSAETTGPSPPSFRSRIMFSLISMSFSHPAPGPGRAGAERSSWESPSLDGLARPRHHGVMQRDQLADFLRRRREAIRPAEVGVADGPRRRTAGLRREEVAMLAGMSVDYVVRLEQGRSSQPSTQLLASLARALRLSDDERNHLFHLAGHQPPPADGTAGLARAGLLRLLDLLGDTAALVVSDLGEVLAQNRASLLLTGDHTNLTGDRRYLVYRWFTAPAAREVTPQEELEYHARQPV